MSDRQRPSRTTRKVAATPGRSHSELFAAAVDAAEEIADPSWELRLRVALAGLEASDVDRLLAAGGPDGADGLVRILGVRLDPRFVRSGLGKAVIGPVRSRAKHIPGQLADVLLLPALVPVLERALGDDFDDPSATQVADAFAVIDDRFGERVTLAFATSVAASSAPAAPLAAAEVARRSPELAALVAEN